MNPTVGYINGKLKDLLKEGFKDFKSMHIRDLKIFFCSRLWLLVTFLLQVEVYIPDFEG